MGPEENNLVLAEAQEVEDKKTTPRVITLAELIISATEYMDKKKPIEELNKLGEDMVIRTYIPLLDKMKLMMGIIFKMQSEDTETQEIRAIRMEKDLFFDVLLGTYAGIDVSNEDLKTYDSYDLLYPFFAKFILQFCIDDYNKFLGLLDDSINFYNINDLIKVNENIDYQALKQAADENRRVLKELQDSKELITELREVFALANPDNLQVSEAIKKIAKKYREKNEEATENTNTKMTKTVPKRTTSRKKK